MNEPIARQWIAALRSGEYTQGQGELCTGGKKPKHCCLGVLCEIAVSEGKLHDGMSTIRSQRAGGNGVVFDGAAGMLPPRVARWAGMNTPSWRNMNARDGGSLSLVGDYGDGEGDLVSDNDNGKTFAEIADIIEKHWEKM